MNERVEPPEEPQKNPWIMLSTQRQVGTRSWLTS